MAKVQYGGGVTAITGSIGGWSFQSNRSGNIIRVRGSTLKNSTTKQTSAHQNLSSFYQEWQTITAEEKVSWDAFAVANPRVDRYGTTKTLTGLNWFSSINYYRVLVGESILTTAPVYAAPTAVQDYNYAVRSLDILLHFGPDFNPADNALLIFTTPFTSRITTSQRQNMRLTKVIAAGPYSFIDLTSDWEITHDMSWPPSDPPICGWVGIMVQTIKKSSGVSSAALIKTNGLTTGQEGINYMSISNDFIVKLGYIWDADAQILFDRMTIQPNYTRQVLINNLIVGLKADGNWAELDVLVILADKASQSSLLDWKNLQDGALVNAPAFVIDRGYTSDGFTSYINTQFNPTIDAVKYTQNDASILIYIRSDIAEATADIGLIAVGPLNASTLNTRNLTNDIVARLNSNSTANKAITKSSQLSSVKRIVNNSFEILKNGISLGFQADTSQAFVNNKFYSLCENLIGVGAVSFSSRQQALYAFGSGALNHLTFNNRIKTYFDAIGASVV